MTRRPPQGLARAYATQAKGRAELLAKRPDDVVITFAKRTALGRARKGQLKDVPVDELLQALFKATFEKTKLDPSLLEDICVGTCHPPSPLYVSRAAATAAGIPVEVPISTVNRLCSSGLQSIVTISNAVRTKQIELGMAVGVENMTLNPRPTPEITAAVDQHPQAHDCVQPMGWTSEMVARAYNVSRQKQDEYALISHTRAAKSVKSGIFSEEIIPIEVRGAVISVDDTVRPGVTLESLAGLKPAFLEDGASTAGNSSGIGDGAALCILTSRARAEKEGWEVLGKYVSSAFVGVEPRYMGIGPVAAIPKVLAKTGLQKEDVDVWEINEAFASQFAYCVEQLQVPIEKINPNGGSIALTHPLGMTGTRQVVTGLAELKRRGADILCTSMCIGSGMGGAAIFVNEARP
ncbi:thiolase [Trametes versicolor FP-101664 SS1]|uniref:thiolase n=1 Tax=Trametes versicolor (strain FP-101664) TaxID=717944 RepID=UPI0004621E4E|nr:thiolase [Trametes versicolor FP-101664 SS1]EIW64694.1 thiolase [Trametes versicolor FP-101664 SS1]